MRTAVVLALLLMSVRGHAEPVRWTAPEACGTVDALHARIAEMLELPLDGLRADVAIARDDAAGEFTAELEIASAVGTTRRRVRAPDCATVVEAIAFVLTLAAQEQEARKAPVVPRVVASDPPALGVEARPGPRPSRLHVRTRGGGEVVLGVVPGTGVGAGARVEIRKGWLGVGLGVVGYLPVTAQVDGIAIGEIDLVAARLRGCGHRGALRLCGGGEVGRLRGVGMETSASRRWSALTVGVGWTHAFTPWLAAVIDVESGVALDRPRFTLDDGTLVHQPPPASARAAVGVEVGW
ncbi:MAG: hypothetical protein KIT31_37555 [Deltaproteobacteria bacterium]|nr:hypothetical protein [Deltaproteobacteria bacterium]